LLRLPPLFEPKLSKFIQRYNRDPFYRNERVVYPAGENIVKIEFVHAVFFGESAENMERSIRYPDSELNELFIIIFHSANVFPSIPQRFACAHNKTSFQS